MVTARMDVLRRGMLVLRALLAAADCGMPGGSTAHTEPHRGGEGG